MVALLSRPWPVLEHGTSSSHLDMTDIELPGDVTRERIIAKHQSTPIEGVPVPGVLTFGENHRPLLRNSIARLGICDTKQQHVALGISSPGDLTGIGRDVFT
jgi:hypothetical protein